MKLDDAIELGKEGAWKEAQVRVSPGKGREWFIMLHDNHNKSFVLAYNDDKPIATGDLNELKLLIKSLGLKEFTTFL